MSLEQNIYNQFKIPIEYVVHNELPSTLVDDLEIDGSRNIYTNLLCDTSNTYVANEQQQQHQKSIILDKWSKFYTTDTEYLQQFQKFINTYKPIQLIPNSFFNTWKTFKSQTSFKQNYYYIEWDHLDFCNKNPQMMQIMSFYNLISPVLSLIIPVIFLIFPFVILRFVQKIPITLDRYIEELKKQFGNHTLGKMISSFSDGSNMNNKVMAVMGLAFYAFSIYQNILICVRFYKNLVSIKQTLYALKQHCCYTINIIDSITDTIETINTPDTLNNFYDELITKKVQLNNIVLTCDYVNNYKFSFTEILNVGRYMADLYDIFYSNEIDDTLAYSFGMNEFAHNITALKGKIQAKKVNKTSYHKKSNSSGLCFEEQREKHKIPQKHSMFKKQYYLPLINTEHVKNTVSLKHNIIITGPNASGKTTTLKTTLLNQLLSQQIGFGCYSSAKVCVYDNFFCYLNIPDTSARDSLFQAEARRCLEILTTIQSNKNTNNLCVFDELFSGTNNNEATQSASAYLSFIASLPCRFILTTHYYELTDLEKQTSLNIANNHMETRNSKPTYKFKKGISYKKSGFKVLEDLNYPQEIIDMLV